MRRMLIAMTLFVLSACSFHSNQATEEMDTPPIQYVDEEEMIDLDEQLEEEQNKRPPEDEKEEPTTYVERELYLIDAHGYVVPQTIEVPQTEAVLKQSLQYLVDGGPITERLPNGFRAVLPAETAIDVHLKADEKIAIVDFSEHFKEYHPDDELRILQAITWTLTQFNNVDAIQIRINGYDLEMMPVNGTPIDAAHSRENGINIEATNVSDVVNSKAVTLYFLAQGNEKTYYVPITRRVQSDDDLLTTAVAELLKGPSFSSHLLSDIRPNVTLQEKPTYENGVVTVHLNDAILSEKEATALSEETMAMFALTLTEQDGVERVAIAVDGKGVFTEEGKEIEPVMRPAFIN